ncbi:hypothetical protein B7463_g7636, partial [Scytalidium lignicola]
MDIRLSYNDDEYVKSCLSRSQCLELEYQESLRNADKIVQDEGARRLRLQILLLENENDDLHEQLALDDDRIDSLEEETERLQLDLQSAQDYSSHYSNELRLKERELNSLKIELNSVNGSNMDSTKLLTEKLSLARELANLKPEVEHLRSQVAYQQTVLSEKLALQRQVSTLEVELENEKRASKRAAQKNNNSEIEAEMKQQMEDLRKEHVREKREMEKTLKDLEKESKESEARMNLLENKLEQMKTKLRDTKEQLKECQTELTQARAASSKVVETSKRSDNAGKTSRKRSALEISSDAVIGTPDGVVARGKRAKVKRGKVDQTILGEKSMFSITPYLNRTSSLAPGSPNQGKDVEPLEEKADVDGEGDNVVSKGSPEEKAVGVSEDPISPSSPMPKSRRQGAKKPVPTDQDVLQETKIGKVGNSQPTRKRSQAKPKLEKVIEEDADKNSELEAVEEPLNKENDNQVAKLPKLQLKSTEETGPKKKKRKLLNGGKTLFDEDDGESSKRPAKPLGVQRLLGKGGSKGANPTKLTAFSPLKKDRRGGGASFVA